MNSTIQGGAAGEAALRDEIERLRAQLREIREKPPAVGRCEVVGVFRHTYPNEGPCDRPARWTRDGMKVCGTHRRTGRTARERIIQNATTGKSVTLNAQEVADIAALLTDKEPSR